MLEDLLCVSYCQKFAVASSGMVTSASQLDHNDKYHQSLSWMVSITTLMPDQLLSMIRWQNEPNLRKIHKPIRSQSWHDWKKECYDEHLNNKIHTNGLSVYSPPLSTSLATVIKDNCFLVGTRN